MHTSEKIKMDSKIKKNFRFPVTADMAPVSSLLVYYVTEGGEPVSDVASFHVKLLHKEVYYIDSILII